MRGYSKLFPQSLAQGARGPVPSLSVGACVPCCPNAPFVEGRRPPRLGVPMASPSLVSSAHPHSQVGHIRASGLQHPHYGGRSTSPNAQQRGLAALRDGPRAHDKPSSLGAGWHTQASFPEDALSKQSLTGTGGAGEERRGSKCLPINEDGVFIF